MSWWLSVCVTKHASTQLEVLASPTFLGRECGAPVDIHYIKSLRCRTLQSSLSTLN